jgi:hypothetical protein
MWTEAPAPRRGQDGAPRRAWQRSRPGSVRTRPASRCQGCRRSRGRCPHKAQSSSAPDRPLGATMPGQVEIDDLRVGREPREIRLEVGMVETPRSAVKEHDGGPLTHFKTVGHKRRAVDVEPQSRPLHLNIHPRRILTCSRAENGCGDPPPLQGLAGSGRAARRTGEVDRTGAYRAFSFSPGAGARRRHHPIFEPGQLGGNLLLSPGVLAIAVTRARPTGGTCPTCRLRRASRMRRRQR